MAESMPQWRWGAYILLGNRPMAERHLGDDMSPEVGIVRNSAGMSEFAPEIGVFSDYGWSPSGATSIIWPVKMAVSLTGVVSRFGPMKIS